MLLLSIPARCTLIVALVLLALAPLTGRAAARQPAAGQPAATPEQVLRALGTDKVDADYVVMVDTSASMQQSHLYPQVKRTLSGFLRAMSPTDHLSLITFDEVPAIRYSKAVGASADEAIAQLPKEATGGSTDIGSAIELALDELERPHAAPVASVLMVTDGKHEPPTGSRYPSLDSPAWRLLKARGQRLQARQVSAFAVALGGRTDARLLERAFATTRVLALPARQVGPYLDRLKQSTRIAKARGVIQPDLGAEVQVRWPASVSTLDLGRGAADLELTLHSTSRYLPLLVSDPSIEVSGLSMRTERLPARIELAPGQTRTIPLHLSWSPPGGLHVPRRPEVRAGTLGLRARLDSPWSAVISNPLGMRLEPKLSGASTAYRGTAEVGLSYQAVALPLALLLLLLAGAVLWWAERHPKLSGVLGAQDDLGLDLGRAALRGRRLGLGAGAGSSLALQGDGTVRGRWTRGGRGPKRELALWITYSRDGTPSRRGEAACPAGSSIIVSGVRFTYLAEPVAASPAATVPPPTPPDRLHQVPLE
jgi:hypothetical protein